ncbi:ParB/RepB/Spo0J family partition protein [Streptomyces sp. NPDC090106]|uniref:ParB/RepB/Spo0J family partition protein n=1 Tax=Streptomyces sp. NPDC090106 TaxID=3365946 RepID=UPI0038144296
MSKADRLGSGSAFGAASTARSSRRTVIDDTIGGGDASTAAITDLPVTRISDNPDNPRNHLRSLDETTASVREVGVILPIVVSTIEAYLRDRPHRADDLDDGTHYVLIDGHRRLEAARRAGLATIPVRVDDARVSTDETLLEAAFIANYHRDDMTPLEEAHALQQLVDYYGSQTKAAKRLGIPQATISSKLSLLKLSPELQKDLMTGARAEEHVRNLGKLSADEQKEKADERAETARRKAKQKPPADQLSRRDNHEAAPSTAEPTDQLSRRDNHEAAETEQSVPEPRSHDDAPTGADQTADAPGQPSKLPYDQPTFIAMHLARKMEEPHFFEMLQLLNGMAHERNPEEFRKILQSFSTDASATQAD